MQCSQRGENENRCNYYWTEEGIVTDTFSWREALGPIKGQDASRSLEQILSGSVAEIETNEVEDLCSFRHINPESLTFLVEV
jgi:hypothetical protein